MEQWKLIEGIESAWVRNPSIITTYEVSNFGSIRNARTKRPVKMFAQSDGYLQVSLSNNGKPKSYLVHRIVAEAWIPCNSVDQVEVNHIDGDKQNNHYLNLEWVTHQENMLHAVQSGLFDPSFKLGCSKPKTYKTSNPTNRIGTNNTTNKLTEQDVKNIRARAQNGERYSQISKDYPVSSNYIGSIVRRCTWKHI